jgi:hypothetical protein
MAFIVVRAYEELNDFLPVGKRKTAFMAEISPGSTTKAVIENLGIPHTEVDLVLVNGESADFSRQLGDGDRLSVYPVFESWDIGAVSLVRSRPLRETRFSADVHLGRLARLLRMMGFDTRYDNEADDEELVLEARASGRILLSRDRGLLKRRMVTHGLLVRSLVPREQLAQVFRRVDCAGQVQLFARCMSCNGAIARVSRISVLEHLPPAVAEMCTEFSRCPDCGKVYWRGTHWETMKKLAAEVLGRQNEK